MGLRVAAQPATGSVYPGLARSRSLVTLWILRMLVHFEGAERINERMPTQFRKRVAVRLGTPELLNKMDDEDLAKFTQRLSDTLQNLERSKRRFVLPATLSSNLALIGNRFSLGAAERQILGLAVLFRSDDVFSKIGGMCDEMVNTTDQIHTISGLPLRSIRIATSPRGMLRKTGLVNFVSGGPPAKNIQLCRGGLRMLATSKLAKLEELFDQFVNLARPAELDSSKFSHVTPGIGFLKSVLTEAICSGRLGCNILIYGPPGTGKTELTRVLANEIKTVLYEVSNQTSEGDALDPQYRLRNAATAQALLAGRKALLLFDEVDDIFNDGSSFFGKLSTAESAKSWVNQLLEENPVPTLWIANGVNRMNDAFVRRFDAVVNLKTPPLKQRVNQLRLASAGTLTEHAIERFAASSKLTPAIIARASNVAMRVGPKGQSNESIIEALLDGTLRAQGHQTIREVNRGQNSQSFNPTLCNTVADLAQLASGLQQSKSGRICLYGPPGTGKSAFGHWLAHKLDKQLVFKRMSDLQSPYLGVMERNLANAFEDAIRNDAILQIDEVDSFLRSRELAKQAWEISQVNEFLTQLESFEGIFIATTNLVHGIDSAALRRFDHKVHLDYLRDGQLRSVVREKLTEWGLCQANETRIASRIACLNGVSMGDIAALSRRHKLSAFVSAEDFIDALAEEVRLKGGVTNRMGFL